MPEINAPAAMLGFFAGLVASGLFFAGLAWGMRRALRMRHPAAVLLLSFLLRAALLLGVGWWLARGASPVVSLLAYMLAFFVVRAVALRRARRGNAGSPDRREAQCN